MNDFTQIVKSALEYYDDNTLKHYDKMKTFKYYKVDKDIGKIFFYDKNKILIHDSHYEVIGRLIQAQKIWVWGWSASELTKDIIKTSRKVLNYALDLDTQNISLKTELITSRFQVTHPIQIDIHVALTSFLSKQPMIYKLDYFGKYDTGDAEENIHKITHGDNPINSYYLILVKETNNET